MLRSTYKSLRQDLASAKAFQVNNWYGVLTVLAELLLFSLGSAWLWHSRPLSIAYWAASVFLALSTYRVFVLLHECGHGTLFTDKRANTVVGSLLSTACLVPYIPWRNIHDLHHRWAGVIDKDPTQAHLLKLKNLSGLQKWLARLFWMTYIPVPFIKFVYEVFWGYPFKEWSKGNRAAGLQGILSLLVCLVPHLLLMFGLGVARYLTLVGPMYLFFYVFFEMMNLPQHSGHFPYLSSQHPRPLPYREHDAITRTTYLPKLLATVLCYNFNLHSEHHLFPSAPWYRLPLVTDRIRKLEGCVYEEVGFFSFMAAFRKQDPIELYVNSLPTEESSHASDCHEADRQPEHVGAASVGQGAGERV